MPLFECSRCHTTENTALSNYWWDAEHDGKPPLCSECDPEIGVWHGKFPKRLAAEVRSLDPGSFVDQPLKNAKQETPKP